MATLQPTLEAYTHLETLIRIGILVKHSTSSGQKVVRCQFLDLQLQPKVSAWHQHLHEVNIWRMEVHQHLFCWLQHC